MRPKHATGDEFFHTFRFIGPKTERAEAEMLRHPAYTMPITLDEAVVLISDRYDIHPDTCGGWVVDNSCGYDDNQIIETGRRIRFWREVNDGRKQTG